MRIRVPVALYFFSVATIELSVGGRAIRTDLGSFIAVFRRNPWLMLYIPPSVIVMFLIGGIPGVVSALLIVTPFAAMSFGRSFGPEEAKGLEKLFYLLLALGTVQFLVGSSLLPSFLYSEGRKNVLPHSVLASEPSFAFDALFAQGMILLLYFKGRRAWLPLVLLLVLALSSKVLTVMQDAMLMLLAAGVCLLAASKSRMMFFFVALAPSVLCYLFPVQGKMIGLYFLVEFTSWRQLANIVATGDAGWVEFLFTDYRALVGERLLSEGYYTLYTWIESAFSWFPFLHSIGGRLLALTVFALLFLKMPAINRLTFKERVVLYTCVLIFLYTAPKWQFFTVITMGTVFRIAAERNRAANTADRRTENEEGEEADDSAQPMPGLPQGSVPL
jgi:hypothetical protein